MVLDLRFFWFVSFWILNILYRIGPLLEYVHALSFTRSRLVRMSIWLAPRHRRWSSSVTGAPLLPFYGLIKFQIWYCVSSWWIKVAGVWYERFRTRGSEMEHWHVSHGWVQLMDDCVATSFFRVVAFNISYDTWLRHCLVWILCKMCFRGYVFLLYPHQPGGTRVPFACLRCSPPYTMIGIDTLYYILHMFGVLMNRTPLCLCFICVFMCCVAGWCVLAVSYVWFRVSSSIFVDALFYIHSICMFLCDCMIFGLASCVLVRCRCHFILVDVQVCVSWGFWSSIFVATTHYDGVKSILYGFSLYSVGSTVIREIEVPS